MATFNPETMEQKALYKLLIGSVIPRPIAFVTSTDEKGVLNGAPFSYFNLVSSKPPMVMISVSRTTPFIKDTARNILFSKAFVVHGVNDQNVDAINQTSATLPASVSEVDMVGFTKVKSQKIAVDGILESPVRFECELKHHIELPNNDVFIGEIKMIYIDDSMIDAGKINYEHYKPMARLAGNDYASLGDIITLNRPK